MPILSACLGNHDVWDGAAEPTDAVPATKKGFSLMTGVLGMPAPYYSFDHGGWHFVSLNSMCNWPKYGAAHSGTLRLVEGRPGENETADRTTATYPS